MHGMNLRDRVEEWGAMAFCAFLSLSAFYLLILRGASLSRVILLGLMLICPAVYFMAWLLGGNYRGGGLATPVRWEKDAVRKQVIRPSSQRRSPLVEVPSSSDLRHGKCRIEGS